VIGIVQIVQDQEGRGSPEAVQGSLEHLLESQGGACIHLCRIHGIHIRSCHRHGFRSTTGKRCQKLREKPPEPCPFVYFDPENIFPVPGIVGDLRCQARLAYTGEALDHNGRGPAVVDQAIYGLDLFRTSLEITDCGHIRGEHEFTFTQVPEFPGFHINFAVRFSGAPGIHVGFPGPGNIEVHNSLLNIIADGAERDTVLPAHGPVAFHASVGDQADFLPCVPVVPVLFDADE